jgi:preprotein translocase subunit SecE
MAKKDKRSKKAKELAREVKKEAKKVEHRGR